MAASRSVAKASNNLSGSTGNKYYGAVNVEQELDQVFYPVNLEHGIYRCLYCEEKYGQTGH